MMRVMIDRRSDSAHRLVGGLVTRRIVLESQLLERNFRYEFITTYTY